MARAAAAVSALPMAPAARGTNIRADRVIRLSSTLTGAHPPPPPPPLPDLPTCPPPCVAAAMAALTAKLVGGGYERPDADKELPLDVNYAKLPEWLVRRCSARLGVFTGALVCRCM